MYLLNFVILSLVTFFQLITATSFYSFKVEDANNKEISLKHYEGKVTLVVNVASKCGYTDSTYKALTRLHDILSYDGYFSVLAFPCNQFGEQEPDEISDIIENVRSEYDADFPIFNKIDIVGQNASPAFQNLIEQSSVVPDWNFYKYLVDDKGQVLNAWGTRTSIEEIFEEIQLAVSNTEKKDPSRKNKIHLDDDNDETPKVARDEL